jgi:hypothetical protein
MEFVGENFELILTLIFMIMSGVFGKKWDTWKKKAADAIDVGKAAVDLADKTAKSADDNRVDGEEGTNIRNALEVFKKEIDDLFAENEKVVTKRKMKKRG